MTTRYYAILRVVDGNVKYFDYSNIRPSRRRAWTAFLEVITPEGDRPDIVNPDFRRELVKVWKKKGFHSWRVEITLE